MIVYHGGIDVIEKPDINHSYRPLDFGKGFYITTVKEQAEKWAKRKADIFDKDVAVVNCDEMKDHIISAIKDYFKLQLGRPEILNRIGDNFVVFDFIREDVAQLILNSQLEKIVANIQTAKGITITISSEVKDILIQKSFGNLENGGRGIGNIVEKMFINPLARFIFDEKIKEGTELNVTNIEENNGVSTIKCEVKSID